MVGLLLSALDMDSETKNEFNALRADLRAVNDRIGEVDVRVREVDTRASAIDTRVSAIDMRLSAVGTRLSEVDKRLSTEIRRVETTLRREIRDEGAATRRHFDVVAESLRDDIRIIAEGLMSLGAKVDAMRNT